MALCWNDIEGIKARLEQYREIVDGHWRWKGSKNKEGRGHTRISYKLETVSRVSYYVYVGFNIADKDTHILHKLNCPYKDCFNPECLYVGNHEDNMHDISLKVAITPFYPCGHPRTPENTYSWFRKDRNVHENQCIECSRIRHA